MQIPVTLSFSSESTTARARRRIRNAGESVRRKGRSSDNYEIRVFRSAEIFLVPESVANDHGSVGLANDRDYSLLSRRPEKQISINKSKTT